MTEPEKKIPADDQGQDPDRPGSPPAPSDDNPPPQPPPDQK